MDIFTETAGFSPEQFGSLILFVLLAGMFIWYIMVGSKLFKAQSERPDQSSMRKVIVKLTVATLVVSMVLAFIY